MLMAGRGGQLLIEESFENILNLKKKRKPFNS